MSCGEWLDGIFCGSCGTKAPETASTTQAFAESTPPWSTDEEVASRGTGGPGAGSAATRVQPPGTGEPIAVPPTTQAQPPVAGAPGPAHGATHVQYAVNGDGVTSGVALSVRSKFDEGPPAWSDDVPLDDHPDELGSPFSWAASALRANGAGVGVVTLACVGLWIGMLLVAVLILRIMRGTGLVSLTLFGQFAATTVILLGFVWARLAVSRSWAMVVRGAPVVFGEVFSFRAYPRALFATVLLLPLLTLTVGFAAPFHWLTLELIAAGDMTATQAIGRAFTETCSTWRRFGHFLVIAIFRWIVLVFLVLLFYWLLETLADSAGISAMTNFWNGSSNKFTETEAELTLYLGGTGILIFTYAAVLLNYHLTGLWNAARLRLMTNRPLGAKVSTGLG